MFPLIGEIMKFHYGINSSAEKRDAALGKGFEHFVSDAIVAWCFAVFNFFSNKTDVVHLKVVLERGKFSRTMFNTRILF